MRRSPRSAWPHWKNALHPHDQNTRARGGLQRGAGAGPRLRQRAYQRNLHDSGTQDLRSQHRLKWKSRVGGQTRARWGRTLTFLSGCVPEASVQRMHARCLHK